LTATALSPVKGIDTVRLVSQALNCTTRPVNAALFPGEVSPDEKFSMASVYSNRIHQKLRPFLLDQQNISRKSWMKGKYWKKSESFQK
jgi:hypothetical protein